MKERVVQVKKNDILELLRKNLEEHTIEHFEAVEGWVKKVKKKAQSLLENLSTRTEDSDLRKFIKLAKPEHHIKDYKRAIGMLEMDVRDVVELTEAEYHHFVEDDWEWKSHWSATNSRYLDS